MPKQLTIKEYEYLQQIAQGEDTGMIDPMTTRGDIIVRNASNATARLGVGTNGQVLKSDGTDVAYNTLNFTELGDVPNSFTGNANKLVAVNSGETSLEFISATSILSVVSAQNAYAILDKAGSFTNEDFIATDKMSDSTGTNNTVNTGTTSATFDTNKYQLNTINAALTGTNHDPDTFTDYNNGFDGNFSTYASRSIGGAGPATYTMAIGKTFTNTLIGTVRIKAILRKGTGNDLRAAYLQSYNGSTWSNETTLFSSTVFADQTYDSTYALNKSVQGLRINYSYYVAGASRFGTCELYELDTVTGYQTSNIVVCDSNTLTLDGTESSLLVYCKKTLPANTNITVDISDGTTTISNQNLNQSIDISSLSSGTLKLTFNLSTSNISATPLLYGYSVIKK